MSPRTLAKWGKFLLGISESIESHKWAPSFGFQMNFWIDAVLKEVIRQTLIFLVSSFCKNDFIITLMSSRTPSPLFSRILTAASQNSGNAPHRRWCVSNLRVLHSLSVSISSILWLKIFYSPRSTQMFKKWLLMFSYLCIRLSLFIRTFSLSRGSKLSQQGVAGPLQSLVACSLSSANLPCFNKKRIILFFFQSRRCRLQWRAVCVRCFKNLGKEPKVSLSLFLAVWWHRIKRPPRKLFFQDYGPF